MAGHLLFNSGSNESSLAPQFKWLDNTFKVYICTVKKFPELLPKLTDTGKNLCRQGVFLRLSKKGFLVF
jgi:hypothetical protein